MAGAVLTFASKPAFAASADAYVEIRADEPLGTIAPTIYGHFTEHIGGVIYDGVWVGEKSKIPNKFGIRAALIEKMKASGFQVAYG